MSGPDQNCTVVNGQYQNCNATVLCNINTLLSAENCYNGLDDDGNGLVDRIGNGTALGESKGRRRAVQEGGSRQR